MSSARQSSTRLVYSTEQGQVCPACQQRLTACKCASVAEQQRLAELSGVVKVRRETAGRKGKGVTCIEGVPLPQEELKALTAALKKHCGTGGALKHHIIEIQGDQRSSIKALLEARGFQVKLTGG